LRLYREADQKRELEQRQTDARFAIRKLLATRTISGDHARALKLYAGLDGGPWRSYSQVGKLMKISKERVRQLLYPSKIVLTAGLAGNAPWPPVTTKSSLTPKERSWRQPRAFRWRPHPQKSLATDVFARSTASEQGAHSRI